MTEQTLVFTATVPGTFTVKLNVEFVAAPAPQQPQPQAAPTLPPPGKPA